MLRLATLSYIYLLIECLFFHSPSGLEKEEDQSESIQTKGKGTQGNKSQIKQSYEMPPQQEDTISGVFARESFALKRNHSICSIHGPNRSISSRANSFVDRNSVLKYNNENVDASLGKRFNTSFHHFRFIIAVLGGLAVGFMSLLRLNITVAILNMVNQTQIYLEENPEADLVAYFGEGYKEVGEFEWSNEKQQLIISYYMIAYTVSIAHDCFQQTF